MGQLLLVLAAYGFVATILVAIRGFRREGSWISPERRLRWLALPLVAAIVVIVHLAYLRLLPRGPLAWPGADKLIHFLLFGLAAFGIDLWLGLRHLRLGRLRVPLALLLTFAAAGVEEAAQVFSAARNADPLDLLADLLGMIAVVACGRIALARAQSRSASRYSANDCR